MLTLDNVPATILARLSSLKRDGWQVTEPFSQALKRLKVPEIPKAPSVLKLA